MQIAHTHAHAEFKKKLGHTNHFLITILIGLHGVEQGKVTKPETFNVAWDPKNVSDSVKRSRRFARAAALSWAVDALDSYLNSLRKKEFSSLHARYPELPVSLDVRSIYKKLKAIEAQFSLPPDLPLSLVHLGIQWRNNLVHSSSENQLEECYHRLIRKELLADSTPKNDYGNIDGPTTLALFSQGDYPKFKDVAAIINASVRLVGVIDTHVASKIDATHYADRRIRRYLRDNPKDAPKAFRLWGEVIPERKLRGIVNFLRTRGFSGVTDTDPFVVELVALTADQATARFSQPVDS